MTSLLYHPQLPGSLEDTPLTYVNSLEQLQELREQLTSVKEFAVDLEVGSMVWCSSSPLPHTLTLTLTLTPSHLHYHPLPPSLPPQHHSYRSFQGFLCLMQVSTRDHDYLVDVLELRHHMNLLQDPFTNPSIVKVTLP